MHLYILNQCVCHLPPLRILIGKQVTAGGGSGGTFVKENTAIMKDQIKKYFNRSYSDLLGIESGCFDVLMT